MYIDAFKSYYRRSLLFKMKKILQFNFENRLYKFSSIKIVVLGINFVRGIRESHFQRPACSSAQKTRYFSSKYVLKLNFELISKFQPFQVGD